MTTRRSSVRARSGDRDARSASRALLIRRRRAADQAAITANLDPGEAAVLRRSLESGYQHAMDAAGHAWSMSERSARLAVAGELRLLAVAEQQSRRAAQRERDAAAARSSWRPASRSQALRDRGIDMELEAGQ
jgi:hypothetical protein